jgi:hypothetical protein
MAMRLERHVVVDARNDVEGQRDACAFIPTARLSHRQVDGFVATGHTFRVEALYFFGGWMFGLVWIGILSALRDPDERWQLRTRRACFVLGVAVMLGVTAVIVASSNGPPSSGSSNPSRESIWFYCLGCAVPVTLLAFYFSRSALVRPVVGAVGTLLAVLVLAAGGEAFRAHGQPLDGLAAKAHDHHTLVIAALLIPLLVITLACLPLPRTERSRSRLTPPPDPRVT